MSWRWLGIPVGFVAGTALDLLAGRSDPLAGGLFLATLMAVVLTARLIRSEGARYVFVALGFGLAAGVMNPAARGEGIDPLWALVAIAGGAVLALIEPVSRRFRRQRTA